MTTLRPRNAEAQQAPRTLERYTPLIKKLAYKAHIRAAAIGAPYDEEDLQQEIALVFFKALETYSETAGRSFINYLINGAYMRINSLLRPHETQAKHAFTVSGDSMLKSEDGDRSGVWGNIEDGSLARPLDMIEGNDFAVWLTDPSKSELSDTAAAVVSLIVSQPDVLERQFQAYQRGNEFLREAGHRTRCAPNLTLPLVLQMLGFDPYKARAVVHEVSSAVKRYTRITQR